MKQALVTQEESVTKKLYADYSAFRQQLFANMAAQNQQYDKLLLFKKRKSCWIVFCLYFRRRLPAAATQQHKRNFNPVGSN